MNRAVYRSRQKQDSVSLGPPSSASDFSQWSVQTSRSAGFDGGCKTPQRKSFRVRVRGVAGSCITCFNPRRSVGSVEEALEDDRIRDISNSTKASSISSNSSSKVKYSNSFITASVQDDITDFSIAEVIKATGNFSTANIIGQGGFGTVYRAKLKDGSLVAVKRAIKNTNDNHVTTEFMNEIQTLSKIEHLNLVRLLGYLEHADERIILEEYVSNGTLREHLDGSRGRGLEIGERLDIAIDVAHAVTYLHMYTDQPIIHRDIKASNVLITEKLRAKVADFGLARLAPDDSGATHISTQVKGTAGYLDPEYLSTYQLTEKSDVYSFGVLLVELVSGRRPIEPKRAPRERMTTKWAMQRFRERNAVMAMDPRLRRSPASVRAVERVLALAAECLANSRRSRPSMKHCGEVLWGIRKDFRDTDLAVATAAAAERAEKAEQRREGGVEYRPEPLASVRAE